MDKDFYIILPNEKKIVFDDPKKIFDCLKKVENKKFIHIGQNNTYFKMNGLDVRYDGDNKNKVIYVDVNFNRLRNIKIEYLEVLVFGEKIIFGEIGKGIVFSGRNKKIIIIFSHGLIAYCEILNFASEDTLNYVLRQRKISKKNNFQILVESVILDHLN
jgi:hypothetical protein